MLQGNAERGRLKIKLLNERFLILRKFKLTLMLLMLANIIGIGLVSGQECGELDWCHSRKDLQRTSFVNKDLNVNSPTRAIVLPGVGLIVDGYLDNSINYYGHVNGRLHMEGGIGVGVCLIDLKEDGTFTKVSNTLLGGAPPFIMTYDGGFYYTVDSVFLEVIDTKANIISQLEKRIGFSYEPAASVDVFNGLVFVTQKGTSKINPGISFISRISNTEGALATFNNFSLSPPIFYDKYIFTYKESIIWQYNRQTYALVNYVATSADQYSFMQRSMLAKNDKLFLAVRDQLLVYDTETLNLVSTIDIPGAGILIAMAATNDALFAVGEGPNYFFYKFDLNNPADFERVKGLFKGTSLVATPSYVYGLGEEWPVKSFLYAVKTNDISQFIKISELPRLDKMCIIVGVPDRGIVVGGTYWFRSQNSPDIGLRMKDANGVVRIAAEPDTAVTSPLRIAKSGKVYGIKLVEPGTSTATKIRVKTKAGVKAIAKLD